MGRYESWYMRAVHPEKPLGIWVRHTSHTDKTGRVRGAHWFTLFEPGGVTARKSSFDGPPAEGGGAFSAGAEDASWDLRLTEGEPELRHYPAAWMYRAPIPKTKAVSLHPLARVNGEVQVGERHISLSGWRGMAGHNWGAEHAHRWIWIHSAGFNEEPDGWIDMILGRLKIGGLVTPWISNGAVHAGGRLMRFGGFRRRPVVTEEIGEARIELAGPAGRALIDVSAPSRESNVLWHYADPDGRGHVAANCSIASMTVRLIGAHGDRVLTTRHSAAYELGMDSAPSGWLVQPYRD